MVRRLYEILYEILQFGEAGGFDGAFVFYLEGVGTLAQMLGVEKFAVEACCCVCIVQLLHFLPEFVV